MLWSMVRMATGQAFAGTAVLLLAVLICQGVEGCGWTTTALSGTVQSPNFPSNYPNNLDCVYVITVPADYRITLTFTDFALQDDVDCLKDYVLIRDGEETSPIIDHFCGSSLPKTRRTFGNQMWINFVSDGTTTMRGFKAIFTTGVQAPFFLATSSVPSSSVGGGIHRIDVDTVSNYVVPMDEALYLPVAVDYDIKDRTIYWTEVGLKKGIRGASISGSDMHTVYDTGDGTTVDGLAVDPASRLIFYSDTGRDLIAMVTMSTFAHRTIINTSLDQPRAIVLDIADGVMFWTDWGTNPKIERANYDGTDRRTLISTNLQFVNGLALDVQNNRLYWVDGGTDLVERSDMEGQNRETLLSLTGSYHFFGLVHLDDYLYITDWISGSSTTSSYIRRLNLLNRNFTNYGSISGRRLNDIHVYDPRRPSSETVNGCGNNNGGCDVICIPLPGNSSTCLCPDGQFLAADQRSCQDGCGWVKTDLSGTVESPGSSTYNPNGQSCVYIITAPANRQITLTFTDFELNCTYDSVEIRDGDETSPIIDRLCGLDLPRPRRTFGNQMWIKYVSDGSGNTRGFTATYTTGPQAPFFLTTSSVPSSDVGGSIHRVDVDTLSNYAVPVDDPLYVPIAVDYDTVEQTVYWSEVGREKGIRGSSIDGSGMHEVLDTGSSSLVDGMAVDSASRLIFYTDTGRDLIAMVTISTFAHKTIVGSDLDEPRAIVLDIADGVMFWTDWGTNPKIERANYDSSDRRTLISTNLKYVNGLALDVQNNHLYWVDGGTDVVERSDMEGQNRETLLSLDVTESSHFFGVVYLHDNLYITDWITGGSTSESHIRRLELATGNFTIYGRISGRRLNDIHVYDPQRPSTVNGCGNNNGGCGVICIPLPGNSNKCACPDGQTLASDQWSCVGETGPFAVAVTTTDPQPFETNGNSQMTLTCDPDPAVTVSSYAWSVSCTSQPGNRCVFQPRAPEDDGKRVTCTVSSSDGRVASGELMIQLNYPPQEPPIIHGYSRETVYQAGDTLTLTCSVHGGKPLVASVHFACGTHQDVDDSFGNTYVSSHLFINPLRREDDGVTCFCTARWKDTDWYKLSATETLRVSGVPPKSEDNVVPIAVGCSVGVVVLVAVIIAVICVVKRGWCRSRPKPPQSNLLDEHDYCSLGTLQHPAAQQPGRPFVVNAAYEPDPTPCMSSEMVDNANNSIYDTLNHMSMAIDSDPADDYMKPVAEPHQRPPIPCSWDKRPNPQDSYIHAVSNPHNDYVPKGN